MTPSQEKLISRSPVTGDAVWEGARSTVAQVQEAVRVAAVAFEAWSRVPDEQRLAIVRRYAEVAREAETRIARCISDETGKPLWESRGEAKLVAAKVDATIEAWQQRCHEPALELPGGEGQAVYLPIGVQAILGPFNLPAHLPNGQLVPSILLGNSVVFKPSEFTPAVGQLLVELWGQAGLPEGVLQIVQGDREIGEALVNSPVDGVLFTGSHRAGVSIHRSLAGRPHVLLALEMGGNNPLVVHQVSDQAAAAYQSMVSAFITAGQRCTCARELLLVRGDESEGILKGIVDLASNLVVGAPEDEPEPFMGPLIHDVAATQVLAAQQNLIEMGATPILHAAPVAGHAAMLSPGIVDVTGIDDVSDEEVFGPLLRVRRVDSFEEAMDRAKKSRYGLATSLLSDNAACFDQFRKQLRFGVLNWNQPTVGASGKLPFGGLRDSGNYRPSGFHAVDFCAIATAQMLQPELKMPTTIYPGVTLGTTETTQGGPASTQGGPASTPG